MLTKICVTRQFQEYQKYSCSLSKPVNRAVVTYNCMTPLENLMSSLFSIFKNAEVCLKQNKKLVFPPITGILCLAVHIHGGVLYCGLGWVDFLY